MFFIQKAYVALISWKFCLFTKACSHFGEENTETIFSLTLIKNYVGLSSSLRIRRRKSLAFVSRPTISIILTLRSCVMRRQIMVIPHPFAIQTQSCPMARRDKLWSFCTLLSSRGGRPDDMQRPMWSFCTLLSSRGGGPDDMQRLTQSCAPFVPPGTTSHLHAEISWSPATLVNREERN